MQIISSSDLQDRALSSAWNHKRRAGADRAQNPEDSAGGKEFTSSLGEGKVEGKEGELRLPKAKQDWKQKNGMLQINGRNLNLSQNQFNCCLLEILYPVTDLILITFK